MKQEERRDMDMKWAVEQYVYEITHEDTNRKWRYERQGRLKAPIP